MIFKLTDVVPWGRSALEYQRMFNLRAADWDGRILDCAGGPASFNTEMTTQGHEIVSCDPLYQFSVAQIEKRIAAVRPVILDGVAQTRDRFVWSQITSVEDLETTRMTAMQQFLADLPAGQAAGRYVVGALPHLPFENHFFNLALSSHFLFTYSEQMSTAFHLAAIEELLRVATEVRLFPIVENFTGARSPHLDAVIEAVSPRVRSLDILTVDYEFQKGGNEMLRLVA